jgi:hypothetical protein
MSKRVLDRTEIEGESGSEESTYRLEDDDQPVPVATKKQKCFPFVFIAAKALVGLFIGRPCCQAVRNSRHCVSHS